MSKCNLFITELSTHYRNLNPRPQVSQSGPQTTRPAWYFSSLCFTGFLHTEKRQPLRIRNKYGSVTALKRWPKQKFKPLRRSLKLGTAHHWSEFFFKSDINFISQFFYQSEFKPINKRQFEPSEVMHIMNIRHVISR
jgi:hypothetical protein